MSLPFGDKLVHFGLYSVLGLALAHARRRGDLGVPHVVMIVLGALYGVTDEWHQSFVPNRTPSVWDWVADLAGVVAGYGVWTARLSAGNGPTGDTEEEATT